MIPRYGPDNYRHGVTAFFLLTAITVYLYGGLFTHYPLHTHENLFLYFRIHQYWAELQAFGFPATLFPDGLAGGGFAFPVFYPPVSYYIAVALVAVTGSFYLAGNLAMFLSVLLSGYSAYFSFSRVGKPMAALAAAVMYIAVPYRFVDVFTRGAMAECYTFVLFPLLYAGGVLLLRGNSRQGFYLLCVGSAALLLTHAVMALYFLAISAVLLAAVCAYGRQFKPLVLAVSAMVVAAGLSAWSIVPQRAYFNDVLASDKVLMGSTLDGVISHSLSASQLFYTDHARWSGDSQAGVFLDGMSFELGFPYLACLSALVLVPLWFRRRRAVVPPAENLLFYLAIVVLAASLVFPVRPQWFLTWLPEPFTFIQFGWRMLGISSFFCAVVYIGALSRYRLPRLVAAGLSAAVIVGCVVSINSDYKVARYSVDPPGEPFDPQALAWHSGSGFVVATEYAPKGFGPAQLAVMRSGQSVPSGDITVTTGSISLEKRVYLVSTPTSGSIIVPQAAYPFYRARTDSGRHLTLSSESGLMRVDGIRAGDTKVIIKRTRTTLQKRAMGISIGTAVVLGVAYLVPVARAVRRRRRGL